MAELACAYEQQQSNTTSLSSADLEAEEAPAPFRPAPTPLPAIPRRPASSGSHSEPLPDKPDPEARRDAN